MSGGKKQTIGYKYYLGMHMAVCHGEIDALTGITVGQRELWRGEQAQNGELHIDKPDLLGGEKREGGLGGTLDVLLGGRKQKPNTYLAAKLGAVPAFRGVVSVVLRQFYIGNNPYLKNWAFRVRRVLKRTDGTQQWYPRKAVIKKHHMNPAHIIRECLTDPDWGMGYQARDIDDASFTAAADTLFEEDFGLSILWSKSTEIESFVTTVIRHINAALWVDRKNGKFRLKLIRDGYDADDLPVMDEGQIVSVRDFARPALGELCNTITVKFWNCETGNDDAVTLQDIALINQQGAMIGSTVEYPGIPDGGLAVRVASRDLKTLSTPLIACTLICARDVAETLDIGDVFKLSWPDYGIVESIMRVTNLKFGTQTNNQITLDCVQDAFGLSNAIYAPPPKSDWTPPSNAPKPSPSRLAVTAPYYEIAQQIGDNGARKLTDTDAYLIAAAERPSTDAINAGLWTANGNAYNAYEEAATLDYCPAGTIDADLDYLDGQLTLSGADIDLIPIGSHMQIGDGGSAEIVAVAGKSGAVLTIKRGCLDTIPHRHSQGAHWWAWDAYSATDGQTRMEGERVSVKITPTTGQGTLPLAEAPAETIVLTNRQALPYPPANVRINGVHYPDTAQDADIRLTWSSRNRLQQTAGLIGWTEGNVTAEDGVTYHLLVKKGNRKIIEETAAAASYTISKETDGDGGKTIRYRAGDKLTIELTTHRDGLESMQTYRHEVTII